MKTLKVSTIALSFLLFISFAAIAQTIKGSGNVTKEKHEVEAFSKIKIGGAFDVIITKGNTNSLTVETDDNIQERVISSVSNNTLTVKLKDNKIKNIERLRLYITMPNIEEIEASGASEIKAANFNCKDLTIDISGASEVDLNNFKCSILDIEASGASELDLDIKCTSLKGKISGASEIDIKGSTDKMTLSLSGASSFDAKEFKCENAEIKASGASDAEVNVNNTISAHISGAADCSNVGNAKICKKK